MTLAAVRRATAEHGVSGDTEIDETESAGDNIASRLQRCVRRQGGDLVVMGMRGKHGVGRAVLGNVAKQFLRMATCPVMLIRSETSLSQ
jgi:nucleotide-binding universal stress UspA family protein